jgi:hypothetical protein
MNDRMVDVGALPDIDASTGARERVNREARRDYDLVYLPAACLDRPRADQRGPRPLAGGLDADALRSLIGNWAATEAGEEDGNG